MAASYMVSPEEARQIQTLRAQGQAIRAVARLLGRDRKTVSRYGPRGEDVGRIPDDDALTMRAQYEAGQTIAGIAERWNWSETAVHRALRRAGCVMRAQGRPRRMPVSDADLLAWREDGMSRQALAEQTGMRVGTIDGSLSRARRKRRLGLL